MVQGKAILVVDLGNSSTKIKVMFGKDAKGKYRTRRYELSNVFAPIDEGYEISEDYNPATSTVLRVDAELNGHVIKGNFCNGELQDKEKPLSIIKPSASAKKYDLDSTVLSLRLAFLYGYKAIADIQRKSELDELDINWTVITLLPPGDVSEGREPMTNIVKDITVIDSVFPSIKIDVVTVSNVIVLPEGFCAYAGVVYEKGETYRSSHKFLIDENVLVFDIGAGTTDCVLIKQNKLIQNSKYTITQGGNNVFQFVRRKLRMKGLDLGDSDIKEGIIKGSIRDGAKTIPISDIVNAAKDEVAQKIVSEIGDFIEETDLKVRSVGYLLICGGGSMTDSGSEDIIPLSKKIIENFKRLAPNAELIELPEHIVSKEDEDDNVARVSEPISPRDLNLIGASILAESL